MSQDHFQNADYHIITSAARNSFISDLLCYLCKKMNTIALAATTLVYLCLMYIAVSIYYHEPSDYKDFVSHDKFYACIFLFIVQVKLYRDLTNCTHIFLE